MIQELNVARSSGDLRIGSTIYVRRVKVKVFRELSVVNAVNVYINRV